MSQNDLHPEQFYGAWTLLDWRIGYSDGKITRPFGDGAVGQILYTPGGAMSATVSRPSRTKLSQSNVRHASEQDKAESFDSYFHYAGTWDLVDKTIVHTVEFSMNPNMVGTQQIRKAELKTPNNLVLSAFEPLKNGRQRHHILEWKRANKRPL